MCAFMSSPLDASVVEAEELVESTVDGPGDKWHRYNPRFNGDMRQY